MSDIRYMLGYIYRLLADDGRLIIAVPNNAGFQAGLFRNRWLHLDVPAIFIILIQTLLNYALSQTAFWLKKNVSGI